MLSDVQKIARKTPANAITIIESAGFAVKKSSAHGKVSGPKNSKISGTIIVISPEAGFHEWAQLAADGITWISLRATRGHKKTIAGLTPGQSVTIRSAFVLPDKDGESSWLVYPSIIVT